ncbi:MAG: hypothetical protein ACRYFX_31360 [Janthinobacterium lividum]
MKKLLLLCACLWALALPFRAVAAGPPDIVVVRISDGIGGTITAIITRGEGKSERVTFDSSRGDKGLIAASEGYYKLVHQLYQEGYTLQSTFSSSGAFVVTLLFVKPQ